MKKFKDKMHVIKISIIFLSILMVIARSLDNCHLDFDQVGKEMIVANC